MFIMRKFLFFVDKRMFLMSTLSRFIKTKPTAKPRFIIRKFLFVMGTCRISRHFYLTCTVVLGSCTWLNLWLFMTQSNPERTRPAQERMRTASHRPLRRMLKASSGNGVIKTDPVSLFCFYWPSECRGRLLEWRVDQTRSSSLFLWQFNAAADGPILISAHFVRLPGNDCFRNQTVCKSKGDDCVGMV